MLWLLKVNLNVCQRHRTLLLNPTNTEAVLFDTSPVWRDYNSKQHWHCWDSSAILQQCQAKCHTRHGSESDNGGSTCHWLKSLVICSAAIICVHCISNDQPADIQHCRYGRTQTALCHLSWCLDYANVLLHSTMANKLNMLQVA